MAVACIFCGKEIESSKVWEIKLTKFKTKKESDVGRVYCHMKCFVEKVRPEYTFVKKRAELK